MSFKREGDDYSQLSLLKKRRISDLLAEDIPEDEAFLMRSGRYSCTVCHHRPVFDTIAVLLVHRNGKKHLNHVKNYYAKKQDLMKEVEKRKQLVCLEKQQGNSSSIKQLEDVAPLLTTTRRATHHALLTAAPYKGYRGHAVKQECNSACGKTVHDTRATFFQRVSKTSTQPEHIDSLQSDSSPGNRHLSSNIQSEVAISSHDAKGKNEISKSNGRSSNCLLDDTNITDKSFNVKVQSLEAPVTVLENRYSTSFQLKPYIPKHQRNKGLRDSTCDDCQQSCPKIFVSTKLDLSFTKESSSSQQCLNWNEKPSASKQDSNSTKMPSTFVSNLLRKKAPTNASSIASDVDCEKQTVLVPQSNIKSRKGTSLKRTASSNIKKSSSINVDLKRIDREKYLKLTSSGWRTDWKGGWEQDQDVEFDSDEDGPS